jgi:hypothetical protein
MRHEAHLRPHAACGRGHEVRERRLPMIHRIGSAVGMVLVVLLIGCVPGVSLDQLEGGNSADADTADGDSRPPDAADADVRDDADGTGDDIVVDADADGDADADAVDAADADADADDADADADTCSDGYLDPASGLCWWRGLEDPFVYSMEEAASRCAAEGGRRVPTIGELRTLVRGCPASEPGGSCPDDATYCDGCPRPPWDCLWPPEMGTWTCDPNGYLSSTPSGDPLAPALCLSFGAANIHPCDPDDPYLSGLAVICVRG